jgi:hypothetical protein
LQPQFSNEEHFGNFYDSKNQNWSIKFDSQDDADNLGLFVALARYLDGPTTELVIQDSFLPPKGPSVSDGDTVGVRYIAQTEKDGKLTKYEDNMDKPQPLRLTLGSKKGPIGFDQALDGMRRSQRRIVVVPAGYEGETTVRVYKLVLEKVKRADTPAAAAPTSPVQAPTVPDTADFDLPAVEGSNDKAAILKRIAKMGVAAIPGGGASVEDSEVPEAHVTAAPTSVASPVITPQPASAQPVQPQPTQPLPQQTPGNPNPMIPPGVMPGQMPNMYAQSMYQQPGAFGAPNTAAAFGFPSSPYGAMQPPYGVPNNQLALMPPSFQQQFLATQGIFPTPAPAEPAKPKEDKEESKPFTPDTIKLMVEEHKYKGDIHEKLERVDRKVDEVIERMDGTIFTKNKDIAPGVSPKQLLVAIQRIVTENEKLVAELDVKTSRIDALTESLTRIHETNQRVMEENNKHIEDRSRSHKESAEAGMRQLDQWREEKSALENELNSASRKFQTLKRSYTNLSQELEETKALIDRAKATADSATQKSVEAEAKLLETENALRDEQLLTKKVQGELDAIKEEILVEREGVERIRKQMEDNKQKYIAELTRREGHYDEERSTFETQLESLREALRRERANMGASQQQLEHEIKEQFQLKLRQALDAQENQLTEKLQMKLEEQQQQLESEWRAKVKQAREDSSVVDTLREQLEEQKDYYTQREDAYKQRVGSLVAANQELAARVNEAETAAANAQVVGLPTSGAGLIQVKQLKEQLRQVKAQSKEELQTSIKSVRKNNVCCGNNTLV